MQKLKQRGLIEIHHNAYSRRQRTQTILAWHSESAEIETPQEQPQERKPPRPLQGKSLEKFQEQVRRVRELLEIERGPLPLTQVLALASVSRSVIDRMLAEKVLDTWEEPIDPAEDPFDVGYSPQHTN